MSNFRKKLEEQLNILSMETGSDTPDFILAEYLEDCLVNFDKAVEEGFYMPSSDGAGFLDRLEGRLQGSGKYNTTNETTGLESIVFIPTLQANGFIIRDNQTTVDYLYFDASSNPGYRVNQTQYNWLRMDIEHANTYNITTI